MELADFFIGKPGPGSISEALSKRLPLIVQRNAWTMAHELYNTQWIEAMGVGIVVGSFRQIPEAVRTMLVPDNYSRFRANASTYSNYAVHEIPQMLDDILAGHSVVSPPGSDPRSDSVVRSRRDTPRLA
jgi:1,2-diacylglycerol 3-beta-galactosyltransferase